MVSRSTLSPCSLTRSPILSLIEESGSRVPKSIETKKMSGHLIPCPSNALLFSRRTAMACALFLSDLSWCATEVIFKNFWVMELPVFNTKCSLRFMNIAGTSLRIVAPFLSRIPLRFALVAQEIRTEKTYIIEESKRRFSSSLMISTPSRFS